MAFLQGSRDLPRIFTKILKLILAHLRTFGIDIIMYIDDSLLLADSSHECERSITRACEALDKLGFTIHP